MTTRMPHEREIEGYVLDGMARALWVHAYMIWATEVEPPPVMGESWEEMAPDNAGTRKASMQAAHALEKLLAEANRLRSPALAALFATTWLSGQGRQSGEGTEADHAYAFGHELALVSVGVLDRGDSAMVPSAILVPRLRIELDDDGRELSWDGSADLTHERNPPKRRAPARAKARPGPTHYDDDPSDEEVDAALRRADAEGLRIEDENATIRVTPDIAVALRAYQRTAFEIMSAEAAKRMGDKIERAIARGRVDPYTYEYASYYASEGGYTPNPGAARGVTALLLEDDPMVQKASTRMIKRAYGPNTKVIVVDNVDAAIATLRVHPEIVVVVSDVDVLGDKSGVELFRWVQQHLPHLVDHYMFFTGGHPEVADIHYRYLEKPAMPDDFRKAMRAPAPTRMPPPQEPPRAKTASAGPMSPAEFAKAVHAAMGRVREERPGGLFYGRVGDGNVFISAIWRVLEHDPRFSGMTMAQFKRRLVEANRESLLSLVRADSQGDMEPGDLQASEINDMGATFHLVVVPRQNPCRNPPADLALQRFADDVVAELPNIAANKGPDGRPRGRFGGRKVFVAALWRQLRSSPAFRGMTYEQFKRELVRAHQAQLLVLARADLVAAMDPTEVRESEIDARGAQFHFVVDDE